MPFSMLECEWGHRMNDKHVMSYVRTKTVCENFTDAV